VFNEGKFGKRRIGEGDVAQPLYEAIPVDKDGTIAKVNALDNFGVT
jgi:hypothetical protein